MNNINGSEILMFVKSISSERNLDYDEVLDIFADALAQSLKRSSSDYKEADFRVTIDPKSGDTEVFRRWRVLGEEELMEAPEREMILDEALEKSDSSDVNEGDIIEEPLEGVEFNQRISMLSAKQYLKNRLREAERRQMIDDLLARGEDLVSGQVMRVLRERGDVIVEVNRVDCRLPKSEMIPRESLKVGDRVQALIKDQGADAETRGQQIILTRTNPRFLECLFQRVVPEIEKGVLEIVKAVRAPGNRAKIAVRTNDTRIDPVGTCVGIRGSRVQAVTNELNGERIDIVHWDEDDATFVLRALSPAEVTKINVDRQRERMDVLIEPEALAQSIGKSGANVRLASELTGWELNLKTSEQYEKEMEELAEEKSASLSEILDLDKEVARILYDEGFESLDLVAYAQSAELLEIEGFDQEVVDTIQTRAKEAVEKKENALREKLQTIDERLGALDGMNEQLIYDLALEDILTLEDFADLSADELLDIIEVPSQRASDLIMQARNVLYGDEEEEGTAAAAGD